MVRGVEVPGGMPIDCYDRLGKAGSSSQDVLDRFGPDFRDDDQFRAMRRHADGHDET
jgi:hypothetical protein